MAKVRIFSLAKELGLANKDLISMAASAGIEVKNSALASVSADVADQLREIASKGGGTAVAEEPPKPVKAPPRRPKAQEREIRDLRTTPLPGHRNRPIEEDLVVEEPIEEAIVAEDAAGEVVQEAAAGTDEVSVGEVAAVDQTLADNEAAADNEAVADSEAVPASKAVASEDPAPVAPVTAETPIAEEVAEEPTTVEKVAAAAVEKVSETVEVVAETAAAAAGPVVEAAKAATEAAVETVAETSAKAKDTVVATTADVAAAVAGKTADTAEPAKGTTVEPAAEKPDAIKKSDYVAPTGSGETTKKSPRARMIRRPMTAVGTVRKPKGPKKGSGDEQGPPKDGDKPRSTRKPTLPNIAMPTFKGPVGGEPKKDEKAQKPDVKLSDAFLSQSPGSLIDRIRKGKDRAGGPVTPGGTRRPPRGTSMEQMRNNRRKTTNKRGFINSDDRIRKIGGRRRRRKFDPSTLKTQATVESPVTIRELSEAIGRPVNDILSFFWDLDGERLKTVNSLVEDEDAIMASLELGVELTFKNKVDLEDVLEQRLSPNFEELVADKQVTVGERPPIVTILGHVDHGKTTLVDTLRRSKVTEGEAGGITQHIAAYQVEHEGKRLTFVDTPGHAAFGAMRARGADVTDIIVLVVAADDGVMPQTIESIAHAKEAGKPIVVAMNKMDLPDANQEKVFTDLSQHGLQPQAWGGDTEVVGVSALKGEGIDDLLETLLLTAEVEELKGTSDVQAHGVCLEGFRDEGRGPMAWSIVQQGKLSIGDNVVIGSAFGRVRALYDEYGNELQFAGPSTPVKIAGLDAVPRAGVHLFEMQEIDKARELAERRKEAGHKERLLKRGTSAKSLEEILAGEGPKELPIIVKADTPGSVEAIVSELEKFEHDEVAIRILHEGTGGVNESDVYLASSSGASIIAFQVVAEDGAESLADKEEVEIRRYSIIYELLDDIRNALEGLLEPERREVPTGRAIVLATFTISRIGTVGGCRILNGTIERNNRMHVIRDNAVVGTYSIGSLRREKDDVKEVREGMECGIRLENFNDIKDGDLLEGFRIEEIARKLDS